MKLYCLLTLILAIIGLLKYPYDLSRGLRLHSLMHEPAHYVAAVLPGMFIVLKDKSYPRYYFLIIFLSILLSGSSLGYMGLGLAIILYPRKIAIGKLAAAAGFAVILGYFSYGQFEKLRVRVDDTVAGVLTGDLSEANLSTYALLSNFFVAYKSFESSPIIGNGLGSHMVSRDIHLKNVKGVEVFEKMGAEHLNAKDAASLFSRIMSEQGLIGLIGTFFVIGYYYVGNKDKEKIGIHPIISRAILLYFFCKLFREGHYFSPEMYFFVFLYVFNKFEYEISRKNHKLLNVIAPSKG